MKIESNSSVPLYIQIAEIIEEDIIDGLLLEGERAYSQYQVAEQIGINPATAGKGIKLLEQEGILYKKRGLGMFVADGAKEVIIKKRANYFREHTLKQLLTEAKRLGIDIKEIKNMLDEMEV